MLGYYAGTKKNEQDKRQIEIHNVDLQQTESAEQTRTSLQAKYQTLVIQYQQLAEKYKRELPQGDLALVTTLAKEQLDKGMAPEPFGTDHTFGATAAKLFGSRQQALYFIDACL